MSYTATEVLKHISKANGNFSEAEMRELQRSALGVFKTNEPQVFAEASAMKKSDSQPTKAILFSRDYKASGTSRRAVHEDVDLGGTMEKDIAYSTVSQTFQISHKMTDRNQMSYEEILNNKFRNALLNIYRDENQNIVDFLTLNKTQVSAGNGLMAWNGSDFVYENENSEIERDYIGQNIQAVMRANGYDGSYDVISDQKLFAHLQRLGYNGLNNASNTQAQLSGLSPIEEVKVVNAAYGGFGFVSAKGMIGMTSWIPKKNRNGDGNIDGVAGLYSVMPDPIYGGFFALHITRKGMDTHLAGGERQDIVDSYEISRDNSIGGAFLSTANETPIFAVGQLKS